MGASLLLSGLMGSLFSSADISRSMNDSYPIKGKVGSQAPNADKIDWAKLEQINPDVAGWLRVTGTSIDCPIPLACSPRPDFYLTHTFAGDGSWQGCPYLDARSGGAAKHLMILGHNAPTSPYGFNLIGDAYLPDRFHELDGALWITKNGHFTFEPLISLQVDALDQEVQRFRFRDDSEIAHWLDTMAARPGALKKDAAGTFIPNRVLTLVTCSSALQGENMRTVVVYGTRYSEEEPPTSADSISDQT